MELDHIFLFVPDEFTARTMMDAAGLRVNYARQHPGQGTRNLCACLDDVFLELLWLDGTDVSPATERIGLAARGQGEGSPFGISWRGATSLPTKPYAAPFLPEGVLIPVAAASDELALPFVFQTPGGVPPIDRTDGLPGDRQRPGLATLGACELRLPNPADAAALLASFDALTLEEGPPGLRATMLDANGQPARTVVWDAPPLG